MEAGAKSSDDAEETGIGMELTLTENDKVRKVSQDELFWSSSDNEDDDEPASVNKEGTDYLGNDHDMTRSSHAIALVNGEKSNIIEYISSDRVRVHEYSDNIDSHDDINAMKDMTQI